MRGRWALPFLLPGLMGLALFYLLPFGGGVYYSLTDGSFSNAFVGFANYLWVWGNPMFQLGLRNTLLLSAVCTPLVWLVAYTVAILLRKAAGAALVQNALLIPYLMPTSAVLLIFQVAFDYGGVVNRLLVSLGLERVMWLGSGALRAPVALMYVWKNLGFCAVIFTAALLSVPDAYYEYARLEGAGPVRQAWHVTLPLVAPTAYLVFVLAWINAFKIFKEVYFIAGAYPDEAVYTLQHYMNNMFSKLNYQNVTTAAYSFAAMVILLFLALYALLMRARRGM